MGLSIVAVIVSCLKINVILFIEWEDVGYVVRRIRRRVCFDRSENIKIGYRLQFGLTGPAHCMISS